MEKRKRTFYEIVLKRFFDIILSFLALIIMSPLFLIVSILFLQLGTQIGKNIAMFD